MFGGIVPLDGDPGETASGSHWPAYFEVPDPDAVVNRAREPGGSVLAPATDLAGAGRFARLADPYGARFAVIRSEPPQGWVPVGRHGRERGPGRPASMVACRADGASPRAMRVRRTGFGHRSVCRHLMKTHKS
ncbi:VOC family protein [Streptomyces scabiei]|uniref:VOC family protein n=1 Tax=Streptomyces scabiei TaxID=1930 RepID=UPI00298FB96E|nr:VOC family protein [Streptomyces scabiei]